MLPRVGQTLICAETVIGRFGSADSELFERDVETEAPVPSEEEPTLEESQPDR